MSRRNSCHAPNGKYTRVAVSIHVCMYGVDVMEHLDFDVTTQLCCFPERYLLYSRQAYCPYVTLLFQLFPLVTLSVRLGGGGLGLVVSTSPPYSFSQGRVYFLRNSYF